MSGRGADVQLKGMDVTLGMPVEEASKQRAAGTLNLKISTSGWSPAPCCRAAS